MSVLFRYTTLIQILSFALVAQPALRLKQESAIEKLRDDGSSARRLGKSLRPSQRHVLLTAHPDRSGELLEWVEGVGGRRIASLPGETTLAVIPSDSEPDPELAMVQDINPANKLAPAITAVADQEGYIVVEFHPDVDPADAVNLVLSIGLAVHENPDLAPHHLLAEGPYSLAMSLADWDEVAYIFPASDDLVSGVPLIPCVGFATTGGTVGQYIATIGNGWDGAGRSSAALTYTYGALTAKQTRALVTANIERALGEWSKAAAVTFTPGSQAGASRNLNFLFASGEHGDGYPFDGPGKVLAHTYYPPPNPEPLAGDLHFDADENWNIGADIDVFSVVLHELGHALGLGHSDQPTSVMYPYYKRVQGLAAEDISSIQTLYAGPGSSSTPPAALTLVIQDPGTVSGSTIDLSGAVSGGTGDVRVTWSDTRGHSGTATGTRTWQIAAIPLVVGSNSITITAQDGANALVSKTISVTRVDASLPSITISSPASNSVVTQAVVNVKGTATHSSGISRITWTNSRGGTGTASGTISWSTSLTLAEGSNVLTFTAYAATGASQSATLSLTYNKPVTADTTAPSLTITNPTTTIVRTTNSTFAATGTATDNVGVVQVTWSTNFSYSGTAAGTTQFTANIPLLVGDNVVTVRAKDAAGNTGWRSFTVVRR